MHTKVVDALQRLPDPRVTVRKGEGLKGRQEQGHSKYFTFVFDPHGQSFLVAASEIQVGLIAEPTVVSCFFISTLSRGTAFESENMSCKHFSNKKKAGWSHQMA